MARYAIPDRRRRGAIAPFAAFLLVVLIGMVAFAVDIGWIVLARTQLQAAADAAALAGADALMDGYVQYQTAGLSTTSASQQATILSTTMSTARTKAENFASYNGAGGVSSLTLNSSDIEFGYTSSGGTYTTYFSGQPFPNTIKVTLRRDANANGSLGLFFAPALGTKTTDLKATAAAVIMGGKVNSFNSPGTQTIGMLPMTYDVNRWSSFVSTGQQPDGTTSISTYDNLPQLQVYPSLQDSGNFGQLSLDDSHAGESTESSWVTGGMTSADLADLTSANLIPLSSHTNTWDWVGDTGFKASLVSTVNGYSIDNYPNQTFILPLFTPYNSSTANYSAGTGNGSHYYYNIVQFVGVKIMPGGGNRQVVVQPAAIVNPYAVFDSSSFGIVDTSSSSSIITTFSYPRLSQ